MPDSSSDERRWAPGSYAAAGFAIIILLYNLITSLLSMNRLTDGWLFTENMFSDPPSVVFSHSFLDEPSPIAAGDQLLKVNGQTLEQILQARHEFLTLDPPGWPDGTLLKYEILRGGEHLIVDVPIRRASIWQFYAGYLQAGSGSDLVMLATGLFFFIIGCLVFLLRPANRAAHALLFIGVGFFPITGNNTVPTFFYPSPPVSIPFDVWTLVINPSLMYLVLSFPYPKAPLRHFPRLTALLIYLSWPVAFNLAYFLHMEDWRGYLEVAFAIYPVQILLVMLVTLIALVHTFITVRDPVGRSQLKWMLAGIGSFVFIGVGGWLISAYLFPETMVGGNWLITAIGWFLMPICLAVAITRYRLFDIDLIIRRTLQYSLLTGLLALVYFGGTVLLQGVFSRTTGGSSTPLVTVISTLAIAALFHPLRKRVQVFIDRRFYRQKYDAEKVLAAFSTTLRDEVDLDRLTKSILEVVEETMQPAHLSLWFRQPPGKGQTRRDT